MSINETDNLNPSARLFIPSSGKLVRARTEAAKSTELNCPHAQAAAASVALDTATRATHTESAIRELISQKDYPCIAALRSFHADEYQVGLYGELGTGKTWRDLRRDLLYFLKLQKKSASIYLTFWAVFSTADVDETQFERAMWEELSYLTSTESKDVDWARREFSNPDSKDFRFSLEGSEFFVVGLHPSSSRRGRKFPFPTLVFNVFEQFEELERVGQYGPMVTQNRIRDTRFQGSPNPMVIEHGDSWESIQFSGKANGPDWKCPFRFMSKEQKP
jgi:FPC/CPF motif-containing protein YcgG